MGISVKMESLILVFSVCVACCQFVLLCQSAAFLLHAHILCFRHTRAVDFEVGYFRVNKIFDGFIHIY